MTWPRPRLVADGGPGGSSAVTDRRQGLLGTGGQQTQVIDPLLPHPLKALFLTVLVPKREAKPAAVTLVSPSPFRVGRWDKLKKLCQRWFLSFKVVLTLIPHETITDE